MTHAGHRILWTVIGLLLTAIGAASVVSSLGRMPGIDQDAVLLWSGLLDLWRAIAPWGPAVLIGIGLLLALLGYLLLNRQLRHANGAMLGKLTLTDAEHPRPARDLPGRTSVQGVVLVRGLERDLSRDPLIRQASVLLTGAAPSPDVWIQLYLGPGTRLSAVRDQVRAAVDRFRVTSGLAPGRLDVTARIDPSGSGRLP